MAEQNAEKKTFDALRKAFQITNEDVGQAAADGGALNIVTQGQEQSGVQQTVRPSGRPSHQDIALAKIIAPPAHWKFSADKLLADAGAIASRLLQLDQRIFELRQQEFQTRMDIVQFCMLDAITQKEVNEGLCDKIPLLSATAERADSDAREKSWTKRKGYLDTITTWVDDPTQVKLSNLARDLYIHPWWGVYSGSAPNSLYTGGSAVNSRDFMDLARTNYQISQEAPIANYKLLVAERVDDNAAASARNEAAGAKRDWAEKNMTSYLPQRRNVSRAIIARRYGALLEKNGDHSFKKVIDGLVSIFVGDVARMYQLMTAIYDGAKSVWGVNVHPMPQIVDFYECVGWLRSTDHKIAMAMRNDIRVLIRRNVSQNKNHFDLTAADFGPALNPRIQAIRAYSQSENGDYVDAILTGPQCTVTLNGLVKRGAAPSIDYSGPLIWNRSPLGKWSLDKPTSKETIEIEIECIVRAI